MADYPSFSVIIPTYQRPIELVRCLTAIEKLDYPKENFEVIVVNDGGEMDEKTISSFSSKFDLKLLNQKNSGPAKARNHGALSAKNEFLAFTDDDCEPYRDWLKAFSEHVKLSPSAMLGGLTVNAVKKNVFSTASQTLVDYLYDYGDGSNSNFSFFTSNNLTVPRSKFLSIGGFDESFKLPAAEDRDLGSRWMENNHDKAFVETAIVYHHHNLNWRDFWRQHYNYGRGAYHFHTLRKHRNNQKLKIEPINFYIKMFYFPFIKHPVPRAALISSLFFIGQSANALGFFQETIQSKKRDNS